MNYIDKLIILYYQYLNSLILNKVTVFIYLIIIFIFLYLGYFIYKNYIKNIITQKHVLNYEFTDNLSNNSIITFWHTNWCPHCKTSRIEWDKFKKYLENNKDNKYKNHNISATEKDCDDPNDGERLAKSLDIEQFPTVTLFHKYKTISKDSKIEYDALITKEHLILFIDTFLEIKQE